MQAARSSWEEGGNRQIAAATFEGEHGLFCERMCYVASTTALATLVGDPAWQTLLVFRIGYSTHEGLRSPRRAVNEVVKL